jgi:hypothetical protein
LEPARIEMIQKPSTGKKYATTKDLYMVVDETIKAEIYIMLFEVCIIVVLNKRTLFYQANAPMMSQGA